MWGRSKEERITVLFGVLVGVGVGVELGVGLWVERSLLLCY